MRQSISAAILLLVWSAAPVQREIDRALVDRVRAYVDRFEAEVSALVAEERYTQHLERHVSGSRTRSRRELRSDYVLVKPAEGLSWIGYRDVFEVDGEPVRERDSRVVGILSTTSPDSHARAAAFAFEGARFNLGPARTVNIPTMPLQLAGRQHAGRIALRVRRVDGHDGTATLTLAEPNRPTIVRRPDGSPIYSSGELTVRLSDGAIVRAALTFRATSRKRDVATMVVVYSDVEGILVPVPVSMSESLPLPDGTAWGNAVYSNYRRFQTSSRIR